MTTKEQYPGPYTAEYCRENRISIGAVNERQYEKLRPVFNLPKWKDWIKYVRAWGKSNDFCGHSDESYLNNDSTMYDVNHEITFDEFDFEEFKVPESGWCVRITDQNKQDCIDSANPPQQKQ